MTLRHILLGTVAPLPLIAFAGSASAQSITLAAPPVRQPLDENGVDLSSGSVVVPSSVLGIGGDQGVSHSSVRVSNGWRHNWILSIAVEPSSSGDVYRVQIGGAAAEFRKVNGVFTPLNGELGTLSETASSFTYTTGSGTVYLFSKSLVSLGQSYYEQVAAVGTQVTEPNGSKATLTYKAGSFVLSLATIHTIRLQSVSTNTGYQLKFAYAANTPMASDLGDSWYQITKVTAINAADEFCDPAADTCSLTGSWPSLTYERQTETQNQQTFTLFKVTDALGRQTRFRDDAASRLVAVKRPSETADGVTYSYGPDGRVFSVTIQGSQSRTYTWEQIGPRFISNSYDALGRSHRVITNVNLGQLIATENALGQKTEYTYDTAGRILSAKARSGPMQAVDSETILTRDGRGRVTQVSARLKPGQALPISSLPPRIPRSLRARHAPMLSPATARSPPPTRAER